MIVSLSESIYRDLDRVDELTNILKNTGAVKDTLLGIVKVLELVQHFDALLSLLQQRLPSENTQRLVFRIDSVLQEVKASHKSFETELRQTKQLSSLYTKVQNLVKDVEVLWKIYAQNQTEQPFELLKLVLHLPEMQTQYGTLTSLQTRLVYFFDNPPLTTTQLSDFDQIMQQLTQHLERIEGLDAEITRFLQKTLNKQATLADLTENILQWCQQGKHADAFAIRFTFS